MARLPLPAVLMNTRRARLAPARRGEVSSSPAWRRACASYALLLLCFGLATVTAEAGDFRAEKDRPCWIHTEQFDGIRSSVTLENSFGSVLIEGWERDHVQLVVEKKTRKDYAVDNFQKGVDELDAVQVISTRTSGGGLHIRTEMPRRSLLSRPLRGKTNIEMAYRLKVPRRLHLGVTHDIGSVRIEGMAADIRATADVGEVEVKLAEQEPADVDAGVRVGEVDSDFEGRSDRKAWVGESYRNHEQSAGRRVFLRVGIGSIEVRKVIADEPFSIDVDLID